MVTKTCEVCGKPYQVRPNQALRRHCCSRVCSGKRVYSLREEKPMHPRVKENPAPDYEMLHHLYIEERKTTRQIAKELSFASKTSIQNFLREYGIERRPANNGLLYRGIQEPTKEELIDLVHAQHLSYEDIGIMFGVDKTAIPYWLKKHDIPLPSFRDSYYKGNPPILPSKEELESLYASGISQVDIGTEYGVDGGTIRRLFKEYGLQAKPGGWNGGQRYECKDSHLVRSVYEMKIDNWLFEHDIPHVYEPPLPDKHSHADFLANGWYIEIWGVTDNSIYEARRKRKVQLYYQYNLPLIELGRDFFSSRRQAHLEKRLSKLFTPMPIPLFGISD